METLPAVRLYGKRGSPQAYAIRDFLQRSDVPFEWVELANHEQARAELGLESVDDSRLPVCIFPDGTRMERPTVRQVTEKLGWFRHPSRSEYDVAIYGAGPAGLSASVYAASEGLKTVLVERFAVGGQARTSPKIENYLGFPEGISGADLAERAREQADKFGAEILIHRAGVRGEFTHLQGCRRPRRWDQDRFPRVGLHHGRRVSPPRSARRGPAVRRRGLLRRGRERSPALRQRACRHGGRRQFFGASLAASCPLRPQGDHRHARGALERQRLRISRGSRDAHAEYRNPAEEQSRRPAWRRHAARVTIRNCETGEERTIETSFLFLCLGGVPNTQWAKEVGIVRDEQGYLVTGPDLRKFSSLAEIWKLNREPYYLETSMPGVFAAGDVRHGSIKRVASAVGEGAMTIAFVHRYLASG